MLICLSVVHKMFPLLFKDILENDDIKLDMTFMQSLCMDLVEVIHHCCFVFISIQHLFCNRTIILALHMCYKLYMENNSKPVLYNE